MSAAKQDEFDRPANTVAKPSTLAHVVLRTANFQPMVQFYLNFLGGTITYGNDFLAFITYDHEHHRIAILNVPGTGPKDPKSSGLEHIAFTFQTVRELLLAYRQRRQKGIEPVWAVNHGPTTSVYYKDPDRNMLETQVDNFDTNEAANDFMNSSMFAENPIGTDIDLEDMIRRVREGESEVSLKKRIEVGARMLPDLDAM